MSATPPDSAHIRSVVTMATAQATEIHTSSDTSEKSKRWSLERWYLEADAQELRTITHQVAASAIADSSDHKEKSDGASDGGTSGCDSQSLTPPNSGTGLDLSDEWMVL